MGGKCLEIGAEIGRDGHEIVPEFGRGIGGAGGISLAVREPDRVLWRRTDRSRELNPTPKSERRPVRLRSPFLASA